MKYHFNVLKPHQDEKSDEAVKHLLQNNFCNIAGEMRSGKTLTAIATSCKLGFQKTLFVTTKGAISDVERSLEMIGAKMLVINYESLHKVPKDTYDLIIADECHKLGYVQKQKPTNKRFWSIKRHNTLYLSGTTFSEKFTTAYSLFPFMFPEYKNFYKWAKDWVDVYEIKMPTHSMKKYDRLVKDKEEDLLKMIDEHTVVMTQRDAGIDVQIEDICHSVKNKDLEALIDRIQKKKLFRFKTGEVFVASNISKEFQAVCQLQSGTIKINEESCLALSDYKYVKMMELMKGKKFACFYRYIGEKNMIEFHLAFDGYRFTDDVEEFANTDHKTVFLGQIQSKKEGVNLSVADDIVFFSMPFSNIEYLQSRQRVVSMQKKRPCFAHFLLTDWERKVYNHVVIKKKKFGQAMFRSIY